MSAMENSDWELHKDVIERIYLRANKTLSELMAILESTQNFRAR